MGLCLVGLIAPSVAKEKGGTQNEDAKYLRKAFIDGRGQGWRALGAADFENVNCDPDTWSWRDGVAHCSGKPVGVIASKTPFTNFEMVVEWRHLRYAGNSGIFVWASKKSLDQLRSDSKGRLPAGIEVQVLDLGYEVNWEKNKGEKPDWFTSHGDVFPVRAKMKPFPPMAPNKQRSFPIKRLTKGINKWNHYYIRCINGEVRLWVNGEEVSGGTQCEPKTGYLCLESEGSPVEFRNLRIRVLP
ncbi:MAG: DUF1080 domain-containing protein [Verrucomicrobiae bacterium]|nr:DUF1080 domain-containing protein [Verrucomicrobiae bacterium]NNJ43919.1 DUF1080 domain-containing protein [Akkermansiaceae bacterium]